MTLGFLDLDYESRVVQYDDDATPMALTGKKMLPILKHYGGAMNESLDIMDLLDKSNVLKIKETIGLPEFKEFEAYLNVLGTFSHSLAMPYFIWTPEFNDSSRAYFQKKKEEKRGPFKDLVKNKQKFISQLDDHWEALEKDLHPYYGSDVFTLYDILLASHLWGLYIVPEFQFPPKIHEYLQRVKEKCRFNYHQDFWT
jgi:glutaredoxin 2